jgi:CRISPR-associated protein Cas2
MRDFGDHLPYSIFECQFNAIDFTRCKHVLSEIIKHNEDQVLFLDLGTAEARGERVISAPREIRSTRCCRSHTARWRRI